MRYDGGGVRGAVPCVRVRVHVRLRVRVRVRVRVHVHGHGHVPVRLCVLYVLLCPVWGG